MGAIKRNDRYGSRINCIHKMNGEPILYSIFDLNRSHRVDLMRGKSLYFVFQGFRSGWLALQHLLQLFLPPVSLCRALTTRVCDHNFVRPPQLAYADSDAVPGADGIKGAGAVVHFSNFSRFTEGAGFAIYGAGILVGAALLVVMPESVKVMVDSN